MGSGVDAAHPYCPNAGVDRRRLPAPLAFLGILAQIAIVETLCAKDPEWVKSDERWQYLQHGMTEDHSTDPHLELALSTFDTARQKGTLSDKEFVSLLQMALDNEHMPDRVTKQARGLADVAARRTKGDK